MRDAYGHDGLTIAGRWGTEFHRIVHTHGPGLAELILARHHELIIGNAEPADVVLVQAEREVLDAQARGGGPGSGGPVQRGGSDRRWSDGLRRNLPTWTARSRLLMLRGWTHGVL